MSTADDLSSPFLSPAVAEEEALKALPARLALYSVEWYDLREEIEYFRERLVALGKIVGGYRIPETVYAWDKFPTYKNGNLKRDEMYADAIKELGLMVGN
jgi:hypothetical protein